MDNLTPKEIADEEMINQAFHELLNDYLATKHRKRVEIITKAFNFANQAHRRNSVFLQQRATGR